jgi:hypothetical protein
MTNKVFDTPVKSLEFDKINNQVINNYFFIFS